MPVFSQKGTGESQGIAQQGLKLPVTTISGNLLEIKTGLCESKGGNVNIHLGPAMAVDHVVNQLVIGSTLSIDVFRTDRLPKNAYIAKSLALNDKTIHLRDDNLRPSWAYGGWGAGQGKSPENKRRKLGPCW